VGDGPWDEQLMHCQEDRQLFDNFQFVDFTKIIMSREMPETEKEEQFALEALKKIPSQYAAIISKRIRFVAYLTGTEDTNSWFHLLLPARNVLLVLNSDSFSYCVVVFSDLAADAPSRMPLPPPPPRPVIST
jgi:hypothetical protein